MNPTKDLSVFPPILREFASYKLNIQGCSVKTVDEYLIDLRTFFRYLILIRQGKKPTAENMLEADIRVIDLAFIKRIVTTDIYDFLMYSGSQRGNGKRTSARKLSAIKALFKYLTVKRSLLEVNPAANIESPKQKKQLPKHLSVEESIDLLFHGGGHGGAFARGGNGGGELAPADDGGEIEAAKGGGIHHIDEDASRAAEGGPCFIALIPLTDDHKGGGKGVQQLFG